MKRAHFLFILLPQSAHRHHSPPNKKKNTARHTSRVEMEDLQFTIPDWLRHGPPVFQSGLGRGGRGPARPGQTPQLHPRLATKQAASGPPDCRRSDISNCICTTHVSGRPLSPTAPWFIFFCPPLIRIVRSLASDKPTGSHWSPSSINCNCECIGFSSRSLPHSPSSSPSL